MDRGHGAGDPGLELRLLGPLEALRGTDAVALGGQKPRALLAVLALEVGRVVSVDRIVESLWSERAPETAPHAVQVYVSQLRKALGPVIATRAPGYVLELDSDRVDAHRFVRLADGGTRCAPRRQPGGGRGGAPRGARPVAGPRARRLPLRAVRADRDRPARRAADRRARGASRCRSRSRASRRARRRARGARPGAAASRAATRAAHARALPLGAPGGRARRLPGRARDARRGARHRPRPGAPRARGRDPAPGRHAAARGDASRQAADAVPAAGHDPVRRRGRVDGARGGARRRGARSGPAELLRDGVRSDHEARRNRREVRRRRRHGRVRHARLARGRCPPRRARGARRPGVARGAQRA